MSAERHMAAWDRDAEVGGSGYAMVFGMAEGLDGGGSIRCG